MKEVVLYSKPDCCLCDEALKVLDKVRKTFPFVLKKIDILTDRDLYDQFKDEIPVVFVESKKAFRYRIDESKLIRLLRFEVSGQ